MLYKTTIVIWSRFETGEMQASDVVIEAERGNAYCSMYRPETIADPCGDPDWDGTEFFGPCEEAHDECPECFGTGLLHRYDPDDGPTPETDPCPNCLGTGRTPDWMARLEGLMVRLSGVPGADAERSRLRDANQAFNQASTTLTRDLALGDLIDLILDVEERFPAQEGVTP